MEGKDLWQVTSKKSTVPVFLRLTVIKKKYREQLFGNEKSHS
jgi:hypothetical protein